MQIKGWASVFGEIDSHDDVTIKGCFKSDLKKFTYVRPMLISHDSLKVVGKWDIVKEKKYGLWCVGTVFDDDAKFWIRKHCLSGLSISYSANRVSYENGTRILESISLEEISIVAVPINRACRIIKCSGWDEK
jgi:HK97 family phage prohead protease